MQSFGANLTVGPHFFCLMGQTILVVFSLKTSRACTDTLSYHNDAVKFSKTAKDTNSTCTTCTIVPALVELVFFSRDTSLPSTRNMNAKVAVELYYIFSKMSIF